MVLTRSQARSQLEQQANGPSLTSSSSQQSRSTQSSSSSRRTQPTKRRATRPRKRRREHDEDADDTKQPDKRQKRMDKQERLVLGMSVLSELVCPVCTEIVAGPVTLKCGHSFCYMCICKHIDARYPNTTCPCCRVRIETTYEPKVSVLFQNAIHQMLSSCLFEDSAEKKSYLGRQDEYLTFKVDREQNPPDRAPCQCPSCRRNRGELSSQVDFYRFPLGDEDESEDDEIEPMIRRPGRANPFFDIFEYSESFFRGGLRRGLSDSLSADDDDVVSVVRSNSENSRNRNDRQQANRRQNENSSSVEEPAPRYPFRRTRARRDRA